MKAALLSIDKTGVQKQIKKTKQISVISSWNIRIYNGKCASDVALC